MSEIAVRPSGSTAADSPPAFRVLAIGWEPEQRLALLNDLLRVVRAGGDATLITVDVPAWGQIHPAIKVIDAGTRERTAGPNWLVSIPPRRWAAAAGSVSAALARPGVTRTPVALTGAVWALGARHREEAPWFEHWLASSTYRDLRGWVLWRAVRRDIASITPATLDVIILRDPACWSIAWQVAKMNPQVVVAASVDRVALTEFHEHRERWLQAHRPELSVRPSRRLASRITRKVGRTLRRDGTTRG
jgi:hypothetical protein